MLNKLTEEDLFLANKVVDDIIDDTDVSQINDKITYLIKDYEGNRKRQFLVHLNTLFGNVIINELTWRVDEAENRANEARLVTKKLNNR